MKVEEVEIVAFFLREKHEETAIYSQLQADGFMPKKKKISSVCQERYTL